MAYIPPLPGGRREHIPNHLVWAILSTLFCCLPLGIVSIVHASRVDSRHAMGDLAGAREASSKARFWALLSAALILIPLALYLLFLMLLAGLAMLGAASGVH